MARPQRVVVNRMRDAFKTALKEAMAQMSCDQVWDEWEQFLLDDLKESQCWLSFHDGSAEVLVGLGVGDAAHSLTPQLSAETYDNVAVQWPGQVRDIQEQIEGIDAFMLDLKNLREQLTDALARSLKKPKPKNGVAS